PYSGGGKQNCCASLPVKWHPGLTVVVEWVKDPDPHAYGTGLLSELTVIGLLISCMQLSTPVIEPLCLLHGTNG
ncbi:DUF3304 domain-containing protein, partial [Pseudomonas lundensis]|uniref:DUF3304 domain-containing protein n=1 Tax=Pseudomonas lundensis TaxID=86185 RepID=UPI0024B3C02E